MEKYITRTTILELLLRIEKGQGYSHLLLNNAFLNQDLKDQDKRLITEVVYGTIQHKLTLDYYLNSFLRKSKLQDWVRVLLWMSIYQMVYLDKIPAHAIVHEAVEIAKIRGHKGVASLVNGVLRQIQRKGVPSTNDIENDAYRLAITTSHPLWLVEKLIADYGYQTTKGICYAHLDHKPISVRVQSLKISRLELKRHLENEGFTVECSVLTEDGLVIKKGNILKTSWFKDGYLSIQDQASMLASELVKAQKDMKILDTCSAPGGKATHIAEQMHNEGRLYAYDIHKKKANLIKQHAEKLGLTCIIENQHDARKLGEIHEDESFDRILVDAPCSGLGVISSKPDIKYSKTKEDIEKLARIQFEILKTVSPLLKKGGLLIYSTCTITKEENEEVIASFLDEHDQFDMDPAFVNEIPEKLRKNVGEYGLQILPHMAGTDGFFISKLYKQKTK